MVLAHARRSRRCKIAFWVTFEQRACANIKFHSPLHTHDQTHGLPWVFLLDVSPKFFRVSTTWLWMFSTIFVLERHSFHERLVDAATLPDEPTVSSSSTTSSVSSSKTRRLTIREWRTGRGRNNCKGFTWGVSGAPSKGRHQIAQ